MDLTWARTKRWLGGDRFYLPLLVLLTLLVAYYRNYFDNWTSRFDVFAQLLPWYGYLGQRLREFQIPAWNPYLNSGTPFAGDPQSGWMLVPTMLTFTVFSNAVVAIKAMVGLELLIAGCATYGFARALCLSPAASAVAAIVFEFGPLLYHTTSCCAVRGQMSPWIPVAMLGVELGLGAKLWRARLLPIFLAGFGMSQLYAAFLSQGSLDSLLLIGAYVAYRDFVNPPERARSIRDRLLVGVVVGFGSLAMSALIGAAGLLPRSVFIPETEISSGYGDVTDVLREHIASVTQLLFTLVSDRPSERYLSDGGIAFILFFFGVALSWKRHCVPFFTIFTVITLIMAMGDTPLHSLFYLIPRFKDIHEHYPEQATTVLMIGPAIVAGAGFDALISLRVRSWKLGLLLAPFLGLAGVYVFLHSQGVETAGVTSLVAAGLATALIAIRAARPSVGNQVWANAARVAPALLVVLAFLLPTGFQMLVPMLPISPGSRWEQALSVDAKGSAAARSSRSTAPGRAGEFIQAQLKASGPFRYAGHSGYRFRKPLGPADYDYVRRRTDSGVVGILTNGRAIFPHIYDTQAYNPSQLDRYVCFIQSINGIDQDYHVSFLTSAGLTSKLLPLLNLRYVVLDRSIPGSRSDVAAITAGRTVVFRDKSAAVLEIPGAQPAAAWIVHDVRVEPKAPVLQTMNSVTFDPQSSAIVEQPVDGIQLAMPGAIESASVTSYQPESIRMNVVAGSNGLLVMSEVYETDWRAYVDGKLVNIVPADYAFRGIPIAAGTHQVELRYEPRSLKYGLWTTAASLLAWLIVAIWRGWSALSRRRTGKQWGDGAVLAPVPN